MKTCVLVALLAVLFGSSAWAQLGTVVINNCFEASEPFSGGEAAMSGWEMT